MIIVKYLVLLLLTQSLSHAEDTLKSSIFDIAPWGYRDSNHKITGIEYDIIQAISKETNLNIKISLVPYKRMMHQLDSGAIDFSIFFRGKKSEKISIPLVKWGELDIIVIGRKGVVINNYDDLKKYKICVRLGGYFSNQFDNDKSLRKQQHRDYKSCVERVNNKKSDAVVGTAATLFYEFNKQNIDISALGEPFFLTTKEDWLHMSKKFKDKEKQKKLKEAVHKLVKNKTFERIFSKYLPKKWQHK